MIELKGTDKKSEVVLFTSGFLLVFLIAVRLLFWRNEPINVTGFFDMAMTLSGGALLTQLLNIFQKKKQDDEEPCAYKKYLENEKIGLLNDKIGILKTYANRKGAENEEDSYLHDLLLDFTKIRKKDTSKDNPIRMMGVALDVFFGSNNEIARKITELYNKKTAYFQILLCRTDNRGLKLRTKLIEKKYPDKGAADFFAAKLYNNINMTQTYIKRTLLNNKEENKYLKCYYYGFSPFATIIIIKDIIYYTPNMVQDDSYLRLDSSIGLEHIESEVSFRIRRESKLGEKLTDVFNTFWLLHEKEVDEDKIS